jgi:hypothetical protein
MVGERREDYLVQFEATLGCDDAVEAWGTFRISMMNFVVSDLMRSQADAVKADGLECDNEWLLFLGFLFLDTGLSLCEAT